MLYPLSLHLPLTHPILSFPVIFIGSVFADVPLLDRNQVAEHKSILLELAPDSNKQRHLISAAEWYCGSFRVAMLPYFSVLLRQLYFAELIDEDVVYEWKTSNLRNEFTVEKSLISTERLDMLKQAAGPFVDWLQGADAEDQEGGAGAASANGTEEGDEDDDEPSTNSVEVN